MFVWMIFMDRSDFFFDIDIYALQAYNDVMNIYINRKKLIE